MDLLVHSSARNDVMRTYVLYMPGADEIALIERLASQPQVRIAAVVDPTGMAPGNTAADAAGIPVHWTFQAARIAPGSVIIGSPDALAELEGKGDVETATTEAVLASLAPPAGAPAVAAPPPATARTPALATPARDPEDPVPVPPSPDSSAPASGTRSSDLEERLDDLVSVPVDLESVARGWAGVLALEFDAEEASLAVVRDDGSLLIATGDAAGATRCSEAPCDHPAWDEVLRTARPLRMRRHDGSSAAGVDLHFLPLGGPPPEAVLSFCFSSRAAARHFQARSAALRGVLEARLALLLIRARELPLTDRWRGLSRSLADLIGNRRPSSARASALRAAAREAVGAEETVFVVGNAPLKCSGDPAWASRAPELLGTVRDGRWLVTSADPADGDADGGTLLAVPTPEVPGCGLVCKGKRRRHAAESALFTEADAEIALLIAAAVPGLSSEGLGGKTTDAAGEATAAVSEDLRHALQREMDRADRYHVTFTLAAVRLPSRAAAPEDALRRLALHLRSSDHLHLGPDGVLLVLAPEDAGGATSLRTRLTVLVREEFGLDGGEIPSARAVYPGPYADPSALLARVLSDLGEV